MAQEPFQLMKYENRLEINIIITYSIYSIYSSDISFLNCKF